MLKWFARASVFALLACICSVPLAAFAQDGGSLLSTYLDQTAASNNLPSGDGNISPVEQSLASTLIDSATGFNQSLTSFEQSSPENAAWISNAQQNLVTYNQEMAANANAPVDVRADIISNAVAQYGQDIETLQPSSTFDPRAAAISNAVAQYGVDANALQAQAPNDPRADAISKAVAQYGQQIEQIQAQSPRDPRAEAISDAVAQYSRYVDELNGQNPLSGAEKQAINKTVQQTSNHFIDESDLEYKELIKQHLQRLIDNESEELPLDWVWPTEGIWTRRYGQGSTSGDCSGEGNGDNGGMGAEYYNENDPSQQTQLCVSPTTGVVFLDNNTFRWDRSGSSNTYITETSISSYDNSSTQRVMSVIDDYNIDVITTHTSGSCTVTNVIHYTLYLDSMTFGCSVMPQIQEIGEDDSSTPPDDNISEIIVDPIKAGEYTVTWLPTDQYCDADLKPSFGQVTVTPSSFDSIKLTVNGQTYNLSGDGMRGEFNAYENNLNLTMNRRLLDDFNFVWQASSEDNSESCYAQGVVKLETPAATQPNYTYPSQNGSVIDVGDTSSSGGSSGSPATATTPPTAGNYTVNLSPFPGTECAAELQDKLLDFTQATVSGVNADSFVLETGAENYTIQMIPGANQWIYTAFADDASGMVISVASIEGNTFSGTYTYFAPDGNMCFLNIEATQ